LECCVEHILIIVSGYDSDIGDTDQGAKKGEIEEITGDHRSEGGKTTGYRHEPLEFKIFNADLLGIISVGPKDDRCLFFRAGDDRDNDENYGKEKERAGVEAQVWDDISEFKGKNLLSFNRETEHPAHTCFSS